MIVAVVVLFVVVDVHCNTVFLLTFDGKMCLFVLNEPTAHTNLLYFHLKNYSKVLVGKK